MAASGSQGSSGSLAGESIGSPGSPHSATPPTDWKAGRQRPVVDPETEVVLSLEFFDDGMSRVSRNHLKLTEYGAMKESMQSPLRCSVALVALMVHPAEPAYRHRLV
jgi:hypothetical protein